MPFQQYLDKRAWGQGPRFHDVRCKSVISTTCFYFSVEFLLDSASSYAPTATVSLENVMFLYQVLPGNERIVAHGFKRIGNALFSSYAIPVGEEIIVEGSSSQTVSSGENSFLI